MKNKIGCLGIIALIAMNVTLGTWSVIEILSWFGKSIPLLGNVVIGLFTGQFAVPIAIVGKILKMCGIF